MLCGETLAKQRGVATNHESRRRSSHKEWKREDDSGTELPLTSVHFAESPSP